MIYAITWNGSLEAAIRMHRVNKMKDESLKVK